MDEPEGWSVTIEAPTEGIARRAARDVARAEGHPSPNARILHVEHLGDTRWEVVIEVVTP